MSIATRITEYGLEYKVSDLFSQISTIYSLDEIMTKMVEEDFIGKKMEYIPAVCVPEFLKIAKVD